MMEVKQNATVDLSDLLTSSKNNGIDEDADAVMTDLTETSPHDLINCDVLKQNDQAETIEVENGDVVITSLLKDVDDLDVDMSVTVNSELEDALLAEDDVLPAVSNSNEIEQTLSAVDEILAEKAEISNSTTSSNNIRDPGDDLDTLLSKINDIVEDCIQNETENTSGITIDESIKQIVEAHEDEENNLSESLLMVEEKDVTNDSNLLEEKSEEIIDEMGEKSTPSAETESLIDKNTTTSELAAVVHELSNDVKEVASDASNKSDNDDNDALKDKTKVDNETVTLKKTSIENGLENNDDAEKTEESNKEIVDDTKITSNSIEIYEDVKTALPITVDNEDSLPSPKVSGESTEIINNKTTINVGESEATVDKPSAITDKKTPIESDVTEDKPSALTDEKAPVEEIITSGSVVNDESDDEIVFYVDQPSEINSKETETKCLATLTENTKPSVLNEEVPPTLVKKTSPESDDVVLLLDDEEEELDKSKNGTSKEDISLGDQEEQNESDMISLDTTTETKTKPIEVDNSDNARDEFSIDSSNAKEKPVEKTEVTQTPEETNSNCSSSSNLLQEAKSGKTVADDPTPEEPEHEEEEEDGDVELIIGELKDNESTGKVDDSEIAPPAKRIRLSEEGEEALKKQESGDGLDEADSTNLTEKKQEEKLETETSSVTTQSALKRSHDVIELEVDEKSNDSKQEINKKLKTDSSKDDVLSSEITYESLAEKQSECIKYDDDDKKELKAVPCHEPIRLYPPPEFKVLKSEMPMSLDFLKKFRKSFDNMTKQDLEELVLQKVVEAIIHKSEFSEMRELIEKQEKLITTHRTKISELSKQFRDLEMVHNRVVKDIEQRNSQFIMPVKITRAVGLQVYIPNKKSLVEATTTAPVPNIPLSPHRPLASKTPSASSTLNATQKPFLSSQPETQRPTSTTSSVSGNTSNVRRGCVQKITPIRPVPGATQSSPAGPAAAASSAYRSPTNHATATQPRILNKNVATTASATAIQRPRYLGSNQDNQRMPAQQQISRSPNMPLNSQRVVVNSGIQSKPTPNVATVVHRRAEPLQSQSSNSSTSSIVDNYINTLTHLTGGNTAVSITPAKPKEKAVIDLTDEDEAPGAMAGPPLASQMSGTVAARRNLPVQNSSNSQLQFGRTAPPLVRVNPSSQLNNKNRQMSSLQAQKSSFTSISTPPGTSITRINVAQNATNIQRVKYSHPAPLPATPLQAFNSSWKLPPPRPTIRISNLDNGIVISWTMEESMDRHAECVSYQIYAYQETSGPPMVDSWRHVGDVKAMLLPMAVTLTQFQEGQRYYFAVRAVDCHQRYGPFSLPKTWS